jgi:hypothetical protein
MNGKGIQRGISNVRLLGKGLCPQLVPSLAAINFGPIVCPDD